MGIYEDKATAQALETWRGQRRCDWCGRTKTLNRRQRCASCDQNRKRAERLEKTVADHPGARAPFGLRHEAEVASQMCADCKMWGGMVKDILSGSLTPLRFEHFMRDVAKQITGSDRTHDGAANLLAAVFTPDQRRFLAYTFWEMLGEQASRNRQSRAQSVVLVQSLRQEPEDARP
jgi:hypothetical protein